jgi:hypothetical protein
MPISRAKGLFPQEADPLFIGLFPAGVSYANRNVEENGDYKRLAFLPYDTLALEVQKAYPGIKFSVRKEHYGSVNIFYPEGFEPVADLKKLCAKYQSAHFDGMQDLEELNAGPWHKLFGGAKYVFTQRNR